MREYTFETIYIVKAPDEATARLVVEKVEKMLSQLRSDVRVVGEWTKLADVEDVHDEEASDGKV